MLRLLLFNLLPGLLWGNVAVGRLVADVRPVGVDAVVVVVVAVGGVGASPPSSSPHQGWGRSSHLTARATWRRLAKVSLKLVVSKAVKVGVFVAAHLSK